MPYDNEGCYEAPNTVTREEMEQMFLEHRRGVVDIVDACFDYVVRVSDHYCGKYEKDELFTSIKDKLNKFIETGYV